MPNTGYRVLLTGAGGFLGSNLLRHRPQEVEIFGIVLNSAAGLEPDRVIDLDLCDAPALQYALQRIEPDIIIHTAAVSGEAACRTDAERARAVNVDCVGALAQWSLRHNCKIVFTSSDLVFDGEKGMYLEGDVRKSDMVYGKMKIAAEDLLADVPGALTVRLPLMYGMGYGDRKGIVGNFLENCRKGIPQEFFTDEFRTPVYAGDAASFIWRLAVSDLSGTFHIAGKQRYSRWEMACIFASHLGLESCDLRKATRASAGMAYRPRDTSLDIRKAESAGFDPRPMAEALREMRHAIEAGLY